MIAHRLDNIILANVIVTQHGLDAIHQIILPEKRQSNETHQRSEIASSRRRVVFDPSDDGFEDLLLRLDAQVVAGDERRDLTRVQVEKFVGAHDVDEVMLRVGVGRRFQVDARVHVAERPYAETVRRVELRLEKRRAEIAHGGELEQIRRREKDLDVRFAHFDSRRVGEVDEKFERAGAHVVEGYVRLTTFGEFAGEHCPEVGRTRCQDDAMGGYRVWARLLVGGVVGRQYDVAELIVAAKFVENGEGAFARRRVVIDVRAPGWVGGCGRGAG